MHDEAYSPMDNGKEGNPGTAVDLLLRSVVLGVHRCLLPIPAPVLTQQESMRDCQCARLCIRIFFPKTRYVRRILLAADEVGDLLPSVKQSGAVFHTNRRPGCVVTYM